MKVVLLTTSGEVNFFIPDEFKDTSIFLDIDDDTKEFKFVEGKIVEVNRKEVE